MSSTTRRLNLRPSTRQQAHPSSIPSTAPSISISNAPIPQSPKNLIEKITRGSNLPNLSPTDLKLLRKKQDRLSLDAPSTRASLPDAHLQNALAASLIFAQHEAGSAVCIDPAGWVITCAHCFGDTYEDYSTSSKTRWLLFYDGQAVLAECRVWDAKRDLALLKIVAAESDAAGAYVDGSAAMGASFPFVTLCPGKSTVKTPIICIGQPGSEDLESATARKTEYNLIEVSRGALRGTTPGVDLCDNSEIGTLKHDAWTYWGHSGAPLLRVVDGGLVGLHSSWDGETGMRHGVPLVAIESFLRGCCEVMGGGSLGQQTLAKQRKLRGAKESKKNEIRGLRKRIRGPDDKEAMA
ncbi:AT hook motif family protein [Paracoccidioides lutzii Pb01]|uniref:AT hook motif family protein n=1 Tax=Paracoccidioides lutzii (strain ATCC MYA-826 / Pb01) TaxID=502779 RepID=C1GQU6_PARBA|nr:AT hook motif family protein [Paracoccidioides lutzii Pb01]EEH37970.1 AT hook motif family protein [Paracoccidioides lutzii Pb01]